MPTVRELISEYGEGLVGEKLWFRAQPQIVTKVSLCEGAIETKDPGGHPWFHDEYATLKISNEMEASTTKTPFHLLDLGFCAAMCRNWEAGIKEGRKANDWETLPQTNETRDRYVAKVLRHLQAYVESDDGDGCCEHLAAIACNANILWHIEGRGE